MDFNNQSNDKKQPTFLAVKSFLVETIVSVFCSDFSCFLKKNRRTKLNGSGKKSWPKKISNGSRSSFHNPI